jgi:surface protein
MTLRRSMPFWGRKKQSGVLPFISTWRTTNTSSGSSASNQVKLPLISTGTYNFTVNWGDGSEDIITVWNQAQTTHTYAASGDYTITIAGICRGWRFANTADRLKILNISSWGIFNTGNTSGAFFGCSNLNVTATDTPKFTENSITTLFEFFRGCSSLVYNSTINNWDVSNITSLENIFLGATLFNQPLNNWNVSNVVVMRGAFLSASNFNQPLNNWNVGAVQFFGGPSGGMFLFATAFNQDISGWNTSSAVNMQAMFQFANAFNQNINGWNVSSVTNFSSMFQSKNNFTFSLNSWNTGNATNMTSMFASSNFNQNITSWNVSKVTNFSNMFQNNAAFNQDISGWTMASIGSINMQGMFDGATALNQNISNWNVSRVTNMLAMFRFANSFNQNIGNWDVSLVTNFSLFMFGKTDINYSASNLDAIYNGWTNRSLSTDITVSFGTIKYTAAATAARDLLTRTNATVTVTNAANNGSGLIRITTGVAHERTTGDKIFISGVTGTTEANGGWIVTVINATTIDLQESTFTNTYVSGGTVRTGYGWTITDGGL